MKGILAVIGCMLLAQSGWAQGGVLVLGGDPALYVPAQPIAYAEQTTYQAPTTIVVQGPVVIQQAPGACATPASGCAPAVPTVIYVNGPVTCAGGYYKPAYCPPPNVIYFGRGQAHQQGYNFSHRR